MEHHCFHSFLSLVTHTARPFPTINFVIKIRLNSASQPSACMICFYYKCFVGTTFLFIRKHFNKDIKAICAGGNHATPLLSE